MSGRGNDQTADQELNKLSKPAINRLLSVLNLIEEAHGGDN